MSRTPAPMSTTPAPMSIMPDAVPFGHLQRDAVVRVATEWEHSSSEMTCRPIPRSDLITRPFKKPSPPEQQVNEQSTLVSTLVRLRMFPFLMRECFHDCLYNIIYCSHHLIISIDQIRKDVYEGGHEIWECSIDLLDYVNSSISLGISSSITFSNFYVLIDDV